MSERLAKISLTGLLLSALLIGIGHAEEGPLSGHAEVIDGDTLSIGDREIDLFGIDAPELLQTCKTRKGKIQKCGSLARQSLIALIGRRQITCDKIVTDATGRSTGHCSMGPLNINEHVVADGWAVADRRAGADFSRAERFAKARKEGLWRTEFLMPWEWRLKQAN